MNLQDLIESTIEDRLNKLGFKKASCESTVVDQKSVQLIESVSYSSQKYDLRIFSGDGDINAKIGLKGKGLDYVLRFSRPERQNMSIEELRTFLPKGFQNLSTKLSNLVVEIELAVKNMDNDITNWST